MSESNKPNELIDFSTYDGSYQEGELLGEDGQAIDLDELKKAEQPPRTPLLIQGAFVIFFVALGGLMYWAFQKTPPSEKPKPPPVVDKFYDVVLSRLVDSRSEFQAVRDCWSVVARAKAGRQKLDAASLQKACPPFKGAKFAYQGACKEDTCTDTKLQKCEGTACQDIEGVSYADFLYALMQRYAEGYNLFYAYQKLYDPLNEKIKDLQSSAPEGKQEPAALTELKNQDKAKRKELQAFLDGTGFDKSSLTTPYFSLPPDILYTQILSQIKDNSPTAETPKDDDDEDSKPKRRTAKPKASDSSTFGGTLYLLRNWPKQISQNAGYKTLTQYFRLEDYADSIGNLVYSSTAYRFWTHDAVERELQQCTATSAKASDKEFTVRLTLLHKTGYPKPETSIQIEPAPTPELNSCYQETLRKRLVYRGLPQKDADGKEIAETNLSFKLRVLN